MGEELPFVPIPDEPDNTRQAVWLIVAAGAAVVVCVCLIPACLCLASLAGS